MEADVGRLEFHECEELEFEVPTLVPVIGMHLQDDEESKAEKVETDNEQRVCMISSGSRENVWHEVTLDSGADLSVLPMSFLNVGEPVEDAQGSSMGSQRHPCW